MRYASDNFVRRNRALRKLHGASLIVANLYFKKMTGLIIR
jgi:hypothetical protein